MSGSFLAQVAVIGDQSDANTLITSLVFGSQDIKQLPTVPAITKRLGERVYSVTFGRGLEQMPAAGVALLLVNGINSAPTTESVLAQTRQVRSQTATAKIIVVAWPSQTTSEYRAGVSRVPDSKLCAVGSLVDPSSTGRVWAEVERAFAPATLAETSAIDSLRRHWTKFAAFFSGPTSRVTLVSGFSLLQMLKLESAQNTIEIGCGSGLLAKFALEIMPPEAKFSALDLADEMVRIAAENLQGYKNATVRQGNAEALTLPDGSFDRYFANYVLHLTPSPENMLREAFRVLRPGGLAGFVVWGRRENSPLFTLTVSVLKKLNLPFNQPTARSPFHLCDAASTRAMVEAAGFKPVITWYSTTPLPVDSGADALKQLLPMPSTSNLLSLLSPEQMEQYQEGFKAEVDGMLARGQPVCQEALLIVATKPAQ